MPAASQATSRKAREVAHPADQENTETRQLTDIVLMISPPSATTIIAIYGAVLSTIAIVQQLLGDRIKVRITVSRDMIMNDPRYNGMTLTVMKVINVGRRPVTITTLGIVSLYPHDNFVGVDNRPELPHEITEGQYITNILDQAGIDFSTIDYWAAWDSHDHVHRLRSASLFGHWKSAIQRKLHRARQENQ